MASGIKAGIAIGHEQAQPGHAGEHGPQRRQLPHEELAGPVRSTRGTSTVRSASTAAKTASAVSAAAARTPPPDR